ncbi:MAG: hypothetical protein ABW189_01560 [Rickettsiales bacterium]
MHRKRKKPYVQNDFDRFMEHFVMAFMMCAMSPFNVVYQLFGGTFGAAMGWCALAGLAFAVWAVKTGFWDAKEGKA